MVYHIFVNCFYSYGMYMDIIIIQNLALIASIQRHQPSGWINLTLPHNQHLSGRCVKYEFIPRHGALVLYNNFILRLWSKVFGLGNEKISRQQAHQSQFHSYNHLWKVCIVYGNINMLNQRVNVYLDVSHMFSWHAPVSICSDTKN